MNSLPQEDSLVVGLLGRIENEFSPTEGLASLRARVLFSIEGCFSLMQMIGCALEDRVLLYL